MVTIHKPEAIRSNGEDTPIMHRHNLQVQKTTGPFKEGETLICYIAKHADGRFGVFENQWRSAHTEKYKVFTEMELHETFHEIE